MKSHPTHNAHTYFQDAGNDDNSLITVKHTPLQHGAAIATYGKQLQRDEVTARMLAIESFHYAASGGESNNGEALRQGATLVAKSEAGVKSWYLSDDGTQLTTVNAYSPAHYDSAPRSADITKEQAAEFLQTLANPYLKGNLGTPPSSLLLSGQRYFVVDQAAVKEVSSRLGVELPSPPRIANTWLSVDRGIVAKRGSGPLELALCVRSAFRAGINDDLVLDKHERPKPGTAGLLPVAFLGSERKQLANRILKNEAEPFISHYRKVDEGHQVLRIEENRAAAWDATLYSEVRGTLVVKSGSFYDKEMLTQRMLKEADNVLGRGRAIEADRGR